MNEKTISRIKELYHASPVAILMGVSWNIMTPGSRMLIIIYLLLWILYKLIPWQYKKLPVSKEPSLESFRKAVKFMHLVIGILLIGMPILGMCAFQLQHKIPAWLESVIIDTAKDKTKLEKLEHHTFSSQGAPLTNASPIYIALVQPNSPTNNVHTASMYGTQSIFLISTAEILRRTVSSLEGVCYLVAVSIFGVFICEILYGVFHRIQQNLAQRGP